MHGNVTEHGIVAATGPAEIEAARRLFLEYADWLQVDLCFQDFDVELATLPGRYAPPDGCLLLALRDGVAAGCVALRRFDAEAGEVKRLYVRPAHRGAGLGSALAHAALQAARVVGYRRLVLDTLPDMAAARRLYESLGFRPIPAYYRNPLACTVYMGLELTG